MVKPLVAALALSALPSTLAFRNTSPFFLFSTAELPLNSVHTAVAQSARVSGQVTDSLKNCPSRTYFIVRQDGVASADYLDALSAPRLALYLGDQHPDVKSHMAVSEVVGSLDTKLISKFLESQCGADVVQVDGSLAEMLKPSARSKDSAPLIVELTFPAPTTSQRSVMLEKHDENLGNLIAGYADSRDYTVIYATTAPTEVQTESTFQTQPTYEMDDAFGNAVHMELKRDMTIHKRASSNDGGLFEKYQFFSPGLFMGLSATIPLFFILFIGLRAISSLEVSYFAFSKEMGPTAQKK
ncbi:BIG1-domain-containing protein [Lindgomyces ingoldianus]|uniref:BIG1-domain-containing protein n=1 Tax=Lindgomyces ingoldianus TaxID=673940 RepID=A0ACB6R820_9PLEO|nr:BIG1-domain-containing protein [Lindgomyces ingoldianus]KAF2474895.1 BIG1-domain-containing protein [Lindgomyces ingoldianus]